MTHEEDDLRRALEARDGDPWRDFLRATAKTTFPVWQMNAIGDLTLHRASGPMPARAPSATRSGTTPWLKPAPPRGS